MRGSFKPISTCDDKYMIGFEDLIYESEKFPLDKIGSWNILPARILGISYAEFLRYARDNYNGIIYGKGHKYPIVKFDNEEDCRQLCKEIWLRWGRI